MNERGRGTDTSNVTHNPKTWVLQFIIYDFDKKEHVYLFSIPLLGRKETYSHREEFSLNTDSISASKTMIISKKE